MGVILLALQSLFPRGHAWRLGKNLREILEALSRSYERVKLFFIGINQERIPLTAQQTLNEWAEALGLNITGSESVSDMQARLEALDTAIGGQTIAYLNSVIQKEFSGIVIEAFTEGANDVSNRHGVAVCGESVHDGYSDYDYEGGSWLYYLVTGILRDGQQQAFGESACQNCPCAYGAHLSLSGSVKKK
jgi:uncharacterized protein YmfQ (DUF2313 family)